MKESKSITENQKCNIIPLTPSNVPVLKFEGIKRLSPLRFNIENFERALFIFKNENRKIGMDLYPIKFLEEEIEDLKFIALKISDILDILLEQET
jgi:hypothetical protein